MRHAVDAGDEGGGGTVARLHEDLRAEQQRSLVLENEAMQLSARVVALERANQVRAGGRPCVCVLGGGGAVCLMHPPLS